MSTATVITWRDLRENLADWINRVRYSSERVVITRHGKVVAELVRPQADASKPQDAQALHRS